MDLRQFRPRTCRFAFAHYLQRFNFTSHSSHACSDSTTVFFVNQHGTRRRCISPYTPISYPESCTKKLLQKGWFKFRCLSHKDSTDAASLAREKKVFMLRETIYILIHPVSFIDRHHGEAVGARIFAIVYLHSTSTFQVRCEVTKERETDLPVFYYRGHELLTFHSFFYVLCCV